ncbi:MAG: hypothetical protein J6W73_05460, partial [Verrucomicrobia bacterium]|nr:hypothetical protein [Verrucomicrobiota bacterium]
MSEEYIEKLIIETFKKAVKMENRNVEMENNHETKPAENIRIIYPCYNDKTKRFSEQEIKQLLSCSDQKWKKCDIKSGIQ